jgi:selenide,water dikinase
MSTPAGPGLSPAATRPLTQYSPGGGCGCKLPQGLLDEVMTSLRGDGLLAGAGGPLRVGLDPADDAAVYDLDGSSPRSLVVTCDFLTPIVDDPYQWGRIAATNALSDVYAMGGRPLLALNLLGWPAELGQESLAQVLRGGARALADAGALLVGGHSIVDPAPKYGLAVVGEVDRDAILRKGGGRAGDVLVLTKPLGVGIVGTAVKRGAAPPAVVEAAVASMTRLNARAAEVARSFGLLGGTDVTGFGLLGHLHEMAVAGGVAARIDAARVPPLPGVSELLASGCGPDGSRRTLANALAGGWFHPGDLADDQQLLLADAQTSGGLLLAVPAPRVDDLVTRLHECGDVAAAAVGVLVEGVPGVVAVGEHPR